MIDLIARSTPQRPGVIKGIGDDTAVLSLNSKRLLLFTADMLAEGTHFTRKMDAKLIGRKSLACSVSDIAAMGGVPTYAVVSLGVPANLKITFVRDLYRGIHALAKEFNIAIVGGDTIKSPKIIVNVALLGEVEKSSFVTRSGAGAGDDIFVTGPLGRSLPSGRHLRFTPRVREALYLLKHFKPTAMIDVSDGLAADLGHILKGSGCGAFLEAKRIPRHKGATLQNAFCDGEDFELLFTLPPRAARRLLKSRPPFHFYKIGTIVSQKESLWLVDERGNVRRIGSKGFAHF